MMIAVTSTVREGLVEAARAAHPQEACGLLFGTGHMVEAHHPAVNVHPTPETHFEIDPQTLVDAYRAMRADGPRLIGFYHSHPTGAPLPSATDRELAAPDGMIWAIVAGGQVTLWRAVAGGLSPLPYHVQGA